MRKWVNSAILVALCAGLATAGEAPEGGGNRGGGNRGGGNRGGRRGGMPGGMQGGMFGGGGSRTNVFDVTGHTAELAPDAALALDGLRYEREGEEYLAIAELRRQLDKKYVEKLVDIVPAAERKAYQAVLAALTERDLAIEAAQTELRTLLTEVRKRQVTKAPDANDPRQRFGRPSYVPNSKTDLLRSHFTLGEGQTAAVNDLRRDGFGKMRDKMREQMRGLMQGGARPDPTAFRAVFTKVRKETEDDAAKLALEFLNEAQRKDFEAACKALDACTDKTTAAAEACKATIIKLVGKEKADKILGTAPRPRPAAAGGNEGAAPIRQPAQRTQEF